MSVQVSNSSTAYNLIDRSDPAFEDFRPDSTTSGAPSDLTIYVKKIVLRSSDSNTQTRERVVFEDATGKPIDISGAKIDLSSLFTEFACINSSGEVVELENGETCPCGLDTNDQPIQKDSQDKCPKISKAEGTLPAGKASVAVGAYSDLIVTYLKKAQVKGCVVGNFRDGSLQPGQHTYCTQKDHTTFTASATTMGGQNADFEDQTPELMDFDLSLSNDYPVDSAATIDVTYPIKDNVEIATSGSVRMTLVIDVNRVLRFFNQGRSDQGAGPELPINRSYFYTSVFTSSSFVFVGKPGDIKGYAFVTKACSSITTIPADHECIDNPFVVAGWVTLIYDKDGNPMAVNIMPDDDNTLTVIKGGNGTRNGLDTTYFTVTPSGLDIKFNLGETDTGKIFNVNTDLAIGATDNTAYFEGLRGDSYGKLVLKRGL